MTHVLIVADGRSPITLGWIRMAQAQDIRVSLVTTFPCRRPDGVEQMFTVTVAFGWASGRGTKSRAANSSTDSRQMGMFKQGFAQARHLLGPLTLPFYRKTFQKIVGQVNPDVVHALRIPYEGMLASYTPRKRPLVMSIWGNDLTLHAPTTPAMRQFTRRCLHRTDALLADVQRDIHLAALWGFRANRPSLVVPGGGGIDLAKMRRCTRLDPKFTKGIPVCDFMSATIFSSNPSNLSSACTLKPFSFARRWTAGQKRKNGWRNGASKNMSSCCQL
jgi:hypothetical protein